MFMPAMQVWIPIDGKVSVNFLFMGKMSSYVVTSTPKANHGKTFYPTNTG
jgi:hypothetical protein